jgi:26S proteasome non-ATPase regulatory subunit 10
MMADCTSIAICEGHGDAAIVLLKAGADPKKEDRDGQLALSLAPDAKIREFIIQSAERDGIEIQ